MVARSVEYDAVVAAPFGRLGVAVEEDALRAIDLLSGGPPLAAPAAGSYVAEVCDQLVAYFRDPSHRFALNVAARGTAFQRRVWQSLQEIAPGATLSYGNLAERLGTGPRAVGRACAINPVPIVVPCHRVVARNGPGGFMGGRGAQSMNMKLWLLAHERG